jgi:hypothetical protein
LDNIDAKVGKLVASQANISKLETWVRHDAQRCRIVEVPEIEFLQLGSAVTFICLRGIDKVK